MRRNRGILFLLIFVALRLTVGCSHTQPYYQTKELKPTQTAAAQEEIKQRILFIGDAGNPKKNGVLPLLQKWAVQAPQKTTVVFLGDNIYPEGLPPEDSPDRKKAEARIMAQIKVIENSGAKGIFIAGNHDWAKGKPAGEEAVKRQAEFINAHLPGDDNFLPEAACPGPEKVDLPGIRLIALDTSWWFHDYFHASWRHCEPDTPAGVTEKLKQLLQETPEESKVIVVGHHPLASYGKHGNLYSWKDHLFPLTHVADWLWIPLPVVGSLYPLARSTIFKSDHDIGSPDYLALENHLLQALQERRPLIYAAGHDHSLQVIDGGDAAKYMLISGAGSESKISEVFSGEDTIFAHGHVGFMAVDFLDGGQVRLRVIEPEEKEVLLDIDLLSRESMDRESR